MYDGAQILAWILALAGNVLIAVLVVRMLSSFAKKEWGDMITNVLGAALLAWIIWGNESFIAFLTWVVRQVTGQA